MPSSALGADVPISVAEEVAPETEHVLVPHHEVALAKW